MVFGFSQNAINVNLNQAGAARIFVTDTIVANNAGGVTARNAGAGQVTVAVHRSTLTQNTGFGMKADGSGGAIILASLSDSVSSGNGTGVLSSGSPSPVGIQVARSSVVNNTTGLQSFGAAFIIVSNTLVSGNGTGLAATAPARLQSYSNNAVDGNTTNGTFTGTIIQE